MSGALIGVAALGMIGAGVTGAIANKNRKGGEMNFRMPEKGPSYRDMQAASGYNASDLAAMQNGGSDPYLSRVADIQRKQSLAELMKMEYGVGGVGPSNYGTLQAAMAQRGLPTGAGSNRTLASYAAMVSDKERAIDDSLNKYLMEGNYNSYQSKMQNAMGFASGELAYEQPTAQWQSPYQQNGWDTASSIFGGIGQLGALGAFSKLNPTSSAFGQSQQYNTGSSASTGPQAYGYQGSDWTPYINTGTDAYVTPYNTGSASSNPSWMGYQQVPMQQPSLTPTVQPSQGMQQTYNPYGGNNQSSSLDRLYTTLNKKGQ